MSSAARPLLYDRRGGVYSIAAVVVESALGAGANL